MNIPFTPEQLEKIREAHIDIIWSAHYQHVTDQDAFDEYITKLSTAHTLATMQLIEQDRLKKE